MRNSKLLVLPALLVALAAALVVSLPAGASGQLVSFYTLSTATNELHPPSPNQGWWSLEDATFGSDTLPNYVAGTDGVLPGTNHYRNFFTFDLSAVGNPCVASSAVLNVEAAYGNQAELASGPFSLAYGLYDVSTSVTALNNKSANPNSVIYNDLGSGTSYGGPYTLSTAVSNTTVFHLSLNANARLALAQAKGSAAHFFSIGGAIVPTPSAANNFLFGNSDAPATLSVTYPKLCRVS
jgi:hypothetical protein